MTGADIWRVIRSNAWLIAVMVLISAVTGYGVNSWLKKYFSRFTAVGTLGEVLPTGAYDDPHAPSFNTVNMAVDQRTHATLLRDPALFTKVLNNPDSDIRKTEWFNSFSTLEDRKANLLDKFDVSIVPDTRLLRVSMTYRDPDSCQKIVQGIVDQYINEQDKLNRDRELDRNVSLQNRRVAEENQLKLISGEITDLQSQLNTYGVTGTQNRIDTKDLELSHLIENRIKLKQDLTLATDNYNRVKSQIDADQDPPQVAAAIYADPQILGDRQTVNNLEIAISNELARYGPDHPSVANLESRKQYIEKQLNDAIAETRVRYRTQALEESKERADAIERELKETSTSIENLEIDVAHLTDLTTNLQQKIDEKRAYESRIKAIDEQQDRLTSYSAKQDFSGVQWWGRPEMPDTPSFPRLPVTMSLAVTIGLVLALGIAFFRELMDTSIRSPRDINRVGSMNLLGMVPHEDDDPQSAGARLPVVIYEAPHSMMAEQLRQVRTRLQHASALDSMRSLLITSPSPGDGKSTIACNLAAGLALNGRRILLVDANFRRPELHRVFLASNEQGFSDVLNDVDRFEHLVQETPVPNLFILPSGFKPTNATELLESQLLVEFIDRALEEFDHVIFDSGPLLFVSETVALAPRVDGVITVVRARSNSRGVLIRTRDSLRQIKAEHLGVVLNAVRATGGGYYGRNIRTYYEYQNGNGDAASVNGHSNGNGHANGNGH